ncbi:MAG: hypothetical protein U0Q12_14325 [Vicinamibacterales bacterium]
MRRALPDRLRFPRRPAMTTDTLRQEIRSRCDTIEETYELMLGYAAQGLRDESGSSSAGQLRVFLSRTDAALGEIPTLFRSLADASAGDIAAKYHAFIAVLERDAQAASAALQLVLAQPRISSQLIDNLNASIHLRALLTDVFLVDELLAE